MNSELFRGKKAALENVSMVNRPLASHLLKIASSSPGRKPGSLHMWGGKENSGRVPSCLIAFSCLPHFFNSQPSERMFTDLWRKQNFLIKNQSAKNKKKAIRYYSALRCGIVSSFCKIQLVLSISSCSCPVTGFMDKQVNAEFSFLSLVLKPTAGQLLGMRFLCACPIPFHEQFWNRVTGNMA